MYHVKAMYSYTCHIQNLFLTDHFIREFRCSTGSKLDLSPGRRQLGQSIYRRKVHHTKRVPLSENIRRKANRNVPGKNMDSARFVNNFMLQ